MDGKEKEGESRIGGTNQNPVHIYFLMEDLYDGNYWKLERFRHDILKQIR